MQINLEDILLIPIALVLVWFIFKIPKYYDDNALPQDICDTLCKYKIGDKVTLLTSYSTMQNEKLEAGTELIVTNIRLTEYANIARIHKNELSEYTASDDLFDLELKTIENNNFLICSATRVESGCVDVQNGNGKRIYKSKRRKLLPALVLGFLELIFLPALIVTGNVSFHSLLIFDCLFIPTFVVFKCDEKKHSIRKKR